MVPLPNIADALTLTSVASDAGTIGLVVLVSVALGALAFPLARWAGFGRPLARQRLRPEEVVRTLVNCAGRGQALGVERVADPLVRRGLSLAAAGADGETIRRELGTQTPSLAVALAPAVGLLVSLACLAAIVSGVQAGIVPGVAGVLGLGLVYGAFILSASAGAAMDRASRLDPADLVVRAMLSAACPAIRDGAGPDAVEQILRSLLPPTSEISPKARLAA